jgi:predicted transcriptional regulator
MKRRIVGIRRPEDLICPVTGRGQLSGWFPSMATMAAPPEDSQALLRLIRDRRPKPLTALAEPTGRQAPNLSRPPRMMEGDGLIKLKRDEHGVEPGALAASSKILID